MVMNQGMAWRLTGEHGEEPGDGVEVWDEADVAQVAAELGVVEGDQLTEHRQVLCNSHRTTRHQQTVDASPTSSRSVTNNQSTRHQQPVDASPTTSRRVTSFQ